MAFATVIGIGPYFEGSGPLNPTLPVGVLPGMLIFCPVESHANEPVPTPSGWAHADGSPVNNANGTRLSVFQRYATGSGDEPTIPDSGDHQSARLIVLNGTHATVPVDVSQATTGDTAAVSADGDTTTDVDRLIIYFLSHGRDISGSDIMFAGHVNADLANITERFDNSTDVGNGGGIACVTGEKAVAGAFGDLTCDMPEDAPWAVLMLAIVPGTAVEESSEESTEESSEESEEDPEIPYTPEYGIDTWQFDTPEELLADRDPIDYYIAYQMMDNSAEARSKKIDAIRITAKAGSPVVQIHAASPDDDISKADIENGTNARATIAFASSTEVRRYSRKKVKIKNLSLWTARYSGTWDGTNERDRLDELIIEGDTHGTEK